MAKSTLSRMAPGQRYDRLVARRLIRKDKFFNVYWEFVCDCGNSIITRASAVRFGNTQSCGCLQRERAQQANTVHGKYLTPEYKVWNGMSQRCSNPKHPAYSRYGGRGIVVCERWHSFKNFFADMGPRHSSGHSIERINNNLGYEPSNCKWAIRKEQQRNRFNNVCIVIDGKSLCFKDACAAVGLNQSTVKGRLERGWALNKALTTKPAAVGRGVRK